MRKAILSLVALLAAAIALAGCGGGVSGTTGGNAGDTTSGVAGAHHAQGSGGLRASVHGFEAKLQTSVQAFQNGNLTKAVAAGGPLLNNCMQIVGTKIAPHASTQAQKQAVTHLRSACGEMSQATSAGTSGNMKKAKQFARAALEQARIAAQLAG